MYSQHSYGHQLCSSSYRLVHLLVLARIHTWTSQVKQKETIPILLFHVDYIDDVLSLNNSNFGDYVHRSHPMEVDKTVNIVKMEYIFMRQMLVGFVLLDLYV